LPKKEDGVSAIPSHREKKGKKGKKKKGKGSFHPILPEERKKKSRAEREERGASSHIIGEEGKGGFLVSVITQGKRGEGSRERGKGDELLLFQHRKRGGKKGEKEIKSNLPIKKGEKKIEEETSFCEKRKGGAAI